MMKIYASFNKNRVEKVNAGVEAAGLDACWRNIE